MSNRPRVKLPDSYKTGDIVEVRTLVAHVMETGNRKDKSGNLVPRNIIHSFVATFAGKEVFRAELNSGISANPFIAFHLRVEGAGDLELAWTDDAGLRMVERIQVTPA